MVRLARWYQDVEASEENRTRLSNYPAKDFLAPCPNTQLP